MCSVVSHMTPKASWCCTVRWSLTQAVLCGGDRVGGQARGAGVHAVVHLVVAGLPVLTQVAWRGGFWYTNTHTTDSAD